MRALKEVGSGDAVDDGDCSVPASVLLQVPQFLKKQKTSEPSPASSISLFDGLTEEELLEILRRLPLKIATLCKSVSKNWLSLISTHHFATSYLRSHNRPPLFAIIHRYHGIIGSGLIRETPTSETLVKLTPLEDILPRYIGPSIHIQYLAASNGWVLCLFLDLFGELYCVVNPLTKKRIILSEIAKVSSQFYRFGFTFCAETEFNSFRVVRFNIPDASTMKLDIFSSEKGEWMPYKFSFASVRSYKRSNYYDSPINYNAIAFNGKLHWLHVWFKSEIFVFDPYQPEKYQRLSLPLDCEGASRYCFGTCQCQGQERKHLKYAEWNDGLIRIWELEDYDRAEWCLLHRVHVSEIISLVSGLPPMLNFLPNVVGFHPWDRELVLCHQSRRFLKYNMWTKTLEVLLEHGRELKLGVGMTGAYFLLELPWWPTPIPSPCSDWSGRCGSF